MPLVASDRIPNWISLRQTKKQTNKQKYCQDTSLHHLAQPFYWCLLYSLLQWQKKIQDSNCTSSVCFLHQDPETVTNFINNGDWTYSRLTILLRKECSFLLYIVAVFKISGNNLIFLAWVMCRSPSQLVWLGVGYRNFRSCPHTWGCDRGRTCDGSSTRTIWKGRSRSLKRKQTLLL